MRTPIFLALALAGCGRSSLADGTYTTTFLDVNTACPTCPDATGSQATWTVSGGGATLNTGTEAVTLTAANGGRVGWTADTSSYVAQAQCTSNMHYVFALAPGPSPVQGDLTVTTSGCATCTCTYKVTMTKQ